MKIWIAKREVKPYTLFLSITKSPFTGRFNTNLTEYHPSKHQYLTYSRTIDTYKTENDARKDFGQIRREFGLKSLKKVI